MLTDGAVDNPEKVYEKVVGLPDSVRISTFGIGNAFDEQLVNKLAKLGGGSVSRIYDLD